MAENKKQNTLLHKRSVKKGVLPQGEILQYGEIAVNYNSEEPFLSIRKDGENKEYAKFSADEVIAKMFDEKYVTIEDLEDNEEVIASALNELNDRIESIQGINIGNSKGESSLLQKVEVETFVDENPDSPTNGQEIPTEASGNHSVVLNGKSNASAKRALAHGNRTIAQGENSHTEGHCTQTVCIDEVTNGYAAHAEGYGSMASGTYSHAEGNKTKTAAPNSHAEGYLSITTPEAESSHAEGYETSTEAPASHTEGNNTKTHKAYSHAEGRQTETFGEASHTEGNETITEGDYAHAEGWMTRAKGAYSHAEGQYTFTYADAAHSEGNNTHAQAPFSHAEGLGTKTNPDIIGQHVEGYYNADSDGVKVIGCGTAVNARMNAVEVKQDGRVFVKGLGNFDGTNSNVAADLTHVVDSKANSNDVYNKTELDNILTANGKIFKAIVSETKYDQIVAAIEDGFYVVCIDKSVNDDPNAELIYYHYKTTYTDDAHTDIDKFCFYRPIEDGWEELSCSYGMVSSKYTGTIWGTENFYYEDLNNKVCEITPESISNIAAYPTAEAVYIALTAKADKTELTELSEEVNEVAEKIDNINPTPMISVTYAELVNLRDNGELIAGMQYRIIDYVTTTVQKDTQSAGHQFDIIVVADDVNVLNENARAIQHEGDTYFSNSDLNAWELKYCLDNDTNRFEWADESNGKGVIYYMKDEWNNECPYDFKNIQFARWELSNPVGYRNDYDFDNCEDNWIQEFTPFDSLKTGFYGLSSSANEFTYGNDDEYWYYKYKVKYTISSSPTYCYTFGKGTDYSISGSNYGNVIKEYRNNNKIQLNNIVFLGNNCYSNSFGYYCYSNTFGNYCYFNSLGNNCRYNSLGNNCRYNSLGDGGNSNSFGNNCYYNCLGVGGNSNSFGNNCISNSLGNNCVSNSFGNNCYYNCLGESCDSNSFGALCSANSFGNECYSNSLGEGCESNSFGIDCGSNSFGIDCSSNSFGNECYSNIFGESKDKLKSYYRYIIFDNGNSNIKLNCTTTTSSSKYYQNVRIGLGVSNKTINDSNVGQTYETYYKPANSQTITI